MSFVQENMQKFFVQPKDPAAVFAQINEHIPEICGLPYDYLFRDNPVAMAECSLLVWEYYDLSLLVANLDVYNFEAESLGQKMCFYEKNIPDVDRSDFLIKTEDDLDKITFNGLESGRFPYFIAYCEAMKKYTGAIPPQNLCAPWSLACNIYGLENLIMACYEDPDFVHAMFEKMIDSLYIPLYKAIIEKFPELLYWQLADAWSSPPMTNMEMIDEFIKPYLEKLNNTIEIEGFRADVAGVWGYNGLAQKDHLVFADYLIDVSGQLSGLDPDVEEIGVEWFNQIASERKVPLMLGLSTNLLQLGPIDDIVTRAACYLTEGLKNDTPVRLFLNNITPHTPSDNVHAAVAAVEYYGNPNIDKENTKFELPQKESFVNFVKEKRTQNTEGYLYDWIQKSIFDF